MYINYIIYLICSPRQFLFTQCGLAKPGRLDTPQRNPQWAKIWDLIFMLFLPVAWILTWNIIGNLSKGSRNSAWRETCSFLCWFLSQDDQSTIGKEALAWKGFSCFTWCCSSILWIHSQCCFQAARTNQHISQLHLWEVLGSLQFKICIQWSCLSDKEKTSRGWREQMWDYWE